MLARACAQNYKTSRMRILRHELRRSATCGGAVDRFHPSLADQHAEYRPAMAFATATVLWNAGGLASTNLPLAACFSDRGLHSVEEPGGRSCVI